MRNPLFRHVAVLLLLGSLAGPQPSIADEPGSAVMGIIRIDGDAPAAKVWMLDPAIQRLTGEKVYREETWLVGENKGLAHCVVTLKAKNQIAPKPMEKAVLDKVGVRYIPRVLVVTPETQVVFRNKESVCRGFKGALRN